jgi:hypothetical protein
LNKDIKEKIHELLNSEALNYLETSERLVLKNVLEKETISKLETETLIKILVKYGKFVRN